MKKILIIGFVFGLISASAQQSVPSCGTTEYMQQLRQDPNVAASLDEAEARLKAFLRDMPFSGSRSGIVRIPVIFHVIHSGEPIGNGKNISDAQILSQIEVLNEDYRKLNSDINQVPGIFAGYTADSRIEFCLAKNDPSGNPTTGIERLNRSFTNFDTQIKPVTYWDPTQYLNIWVTSLANNKLGYATQPGGPDNQDGVVIDYRYVGRSPSNPFNNNYNLGRTATHEVGHWLGLFHNFEGGCVGTTPSSCALEGDYICDTPPESSEYYGCPVFGANTCTESVNDQPDMFMNFMDYCYDRCLHMFTAGQADRMRAVLQTSRLSIQNSLACTDLTPISYSGMVYDMRSNQPVANAKVLLDGVVDVEVSTNGAGQFTAGNLYEGYYDIYVGKWGYMTHQVGADYFITASSAPLQAYIMPGQYYDDFVMDFGWTTQSAATAGNWERGVPQGTISGADISNPDRDVLPDFGLSCYMTGNGGGAPTNSDVDNGKVTLISPSFDPSAQSETWLNYYRWYFNQGTGGNPADDDMVIKVNNGTNTVTLETITASEANSNSWKFKSYRLSDFISLTADMRFIVEVQDKLTGSLTEGAIDKFEVVDSLTVGGATIYDPIDQIQVYPNPARDMVYISCPAAIFISSVEVCDLSGRKISETIHDEKSNVMQLNLSELRPGFYMLRMDAEGRHLQRKLLIVH